MICSETENKTKVPLLGVRESKVAVQEKYTVTKTWWGMEDLLLCSLCLGLGVWQFGQQETGKACKRAWARAATAAEEFPPGSEVPLTSPVPLQAAVQEPWQCRSGYFFFFLSHTSVTVSLWKVYNVRAKSYNCKRLLRTCWKPCFYFSGGLQSPWFLFNSQ